MNNPTQKEKDLQRVQAIKKEYIYHMTKLMKSLSIVRDEAIAINKLTEEDQKIASNYKIPGFFARKTHLIINGYSLAEYAHEALIHLADRLPELFKASQVKIEELDHIRGSKGD